MYITLKTPAYAGDPTTTEIEAENVMSVVRVDKNKDHGCWVRLTKPLEGLYMWLHNPIYCDHSTAEVQELVRANQATPRTFPQTFSMPNHNMTARIGIAVGVIGIISAVAFWLAG